MQYAAAACMAAVVGLFSGLRRPNWDLRFIRVSLYRYFITGM